MPTRKHKKTKVKKHRNKRLSMRLKRKTLKRGGAALAAGGGGGGGRSGFTLGEGSARIPQGYGWDYNWTLPDKLSAVPGLTAFQSLDVDTYQNVRGSMLNLPYDDTHKNHTFFLRELVLRMAHPDRNSPEARAALAAWTVYLGLDASSPDPATIAARIAQLKVLNALLIHDGFEDMPGNGYDRNYAKVCLSAQPVDVLTIKRGGVLNGGFVANLTDIGSYYRKMCVGPIYSAARTHPYGPHAAVEVVYTGYGNMDIAYPTGSLPDNYLWGYAPYNSLSSILEQGNDRTSLALAHMINNECGGEGSSFNLVAASAVMNHRHSGVELVLKKIIIAIRQARMNVTVDGVFNSGYELVVYYSVLVDKNPITMSYFTTTGGYNYNGPDERNHALHFPELEGVTSGILCNIHILMVDLGDNNTLIPLRLDEPIVTSLQLVLNQAGDFHDLTVHTEHHNGLIYYVANTIVNIPLTHDDEHIRAANAVAAHAASQAVEDAQIASIESENHLYWDELVSMKIVPSVEFDPTHQAHKDAIRRYRRVVALGYVFDPTQGAATQAALIRPQLRRHASMKEGDTESQQEVSAENLSGLLRESLNENVTGLTQKQIKQKRRNQKLYDYLLKLFRKDRETAQKRAASPSPTRGARLSRAAAKQVNYAEA